MTTPGAMVKEYEATRDALATRFVTSLRATAMKLDNLRGDVQDATDERDRLLRESAPVLRRDQAAEAAGISVGRLYKVLEGGAQ